jgi:hypothetical protein
MGWIIYSGREPVADPQAECDRIYTWSNVDGSGRVLESAVVGNTWYGAVEVEQPSGDYNLQTHQVENRRVIAGVCLIQRHPFGYKDMTETVGPREDRCPRSILEKLTPLRTDGRDGYAAQWRERAWAHHGGPPQCVQLALAV